MAFYETSNENGFFKIEFASLGLGELNKDGEGFENGWAVTHKEKVIVRGRDAEAALQAAIDTGEAKRFRLPRRLINWNFKRGY